MSTTSLLPGTVVGLGSGRVARVVPVPLACCALEVSSALASLALDDEPLDGLPHVLVVAGTLTPGVAPAVRSAYDALPEPKAVVSYGACAASGGPYWDSYAVCPGAASLLPEDVVAAVIPGCPPPPSTLGPALVELGRRTGWWT